jgi:hypothetical protein
MADDYVPQLDTQEGRHFEATMNSLDQERFKQWDWKWISPAGRTVKLRWREAATRSFDDR